MEQASAALDFERAAVYRDRLAALSAIQGSQGINPRGVEEADVFAVHQQGGYTCVEVFFFRTGQNWGNRAYFPRADRSLEAGEVLGAFMAQFYDDKPPPRCIFLSHEIEDRALLAEALSDQEQPQGRGLAAAAGREEGAGRRMRSPMRARRSAASLPRRPRSSGCSLRSARPSALRKPPRRIEVYDNSHIQGSNAVGAMVVAGPEGFRKNQYRKFNIRSAELTPGDDFGMMREVLTRRFKRLLAEAPRGTGQMQIEPLAPSPSPLVGEGRARSAPGEGSLAGFSKKPLAPAAFERRTLSHKGRGCLSPRRALRRSRVFVRDQDAPDAEPPTRPGPTSS